MKKLRLVWLAAMTLALGACNTPLSAEEVATQVREKSAEVETYHADIQFDLYVESMASGTTVMDNKSTLEVTMNEATMDNFGTIHVTNMGAALKQDYYSIGNQAFMNINDSGWQDVSAMQAEYFQNQGTLYESLVPIIEVLAEKAEMTVEDGSYVFNFEGADAELFEAFAVPYQLQTGDVPGGEMQQQVVAMVDQESLFIQSIENLLTGEGSDNSIQFYLSHRYEDINAVEEFTIPAEVIEAAQANQSE